MSLTNLTRRPVKLAAVALMGLCTSAATPALAQPPVKLPPQTPRALPPQSETDLPPAEEIPVPSETATRYWIGVMCHAVEDALRAHITLPEGQGLMVADVVPDGPAAAAGIARHDILLTASGKPLATTDELVAAVTASGSDPLSVELLRTGKKLTLQVTPVARPAVSRPVLIDSDEQDELQDWMRGLQDQLDERRGGEQKERRAADGRPRRPLRLRFLQPGGPNGGNVDIPLPEGMGSMSFGRGPDGRMRIKVKHQGEEFELGGGQLMNGEEGGKLRERIGPLFEGLMNNPEQLGELFGGGAGRGGNAPADPASQAETEALLPEIDIPGLEGGDDLGLPADAFETSEDLGPLDDLPPADDLDPVETEAAPQPADSQSEAAAPITPPAPVDAASETSNRLPPATAEDADDAELEEVGAAIRELQEQLREIRKQRQSRRAEKAAKKKAGREKRKAAADKESGKQEKKADDKQDAADETENDENAGVI